MGHKWVELKVIGSNLVLHVIIWSYSPYKIRWNEEAYSSWHWCQPCTCAFFLLVMMVCVLYFFFPSVASLRLGLEFRLLKPAQHFLFSDVNCLASALLLCWAWWGCLGSSPLKIKEPYGTPLVGPSDVRSSRCILGLPL